MNKIRLYQILSVLLLPYREQTFLKNDPIAKLRYAFEELKRHRMAHDFNSTYRTQYDEAERELGLFLRDRKELYIHTLDDFRLLLEMFFSEKKVSEKCSVFPGKKGTEPLKELTRKEKEEVLRVYMEPLYLENLYSISRSLLTFRDGKIAIRTWINETDADDIFHYPNVFDKVEIWNLLSRMMTTDLLIVAFFVEADLKQVHYLYNQTGGILLADKTLEKILRRGLAETHMHFTAGNDFMYIWQNEMNPLEWESRFGEDKWERYIKEGTFVLAVYRVLWAEYLEYIE